MIKLYSRICVSFAVVTILHLAYGQHQSFAKDTPKKEILPVSSPKPIKGLPFKPLPFRPLFSTVEFYEFNQKAYVVERHPFDKIIGNMPLLTGNEWKTVGSDPIKFTLIPNKTKAQLGEEIELTLTAELMDVSPQLLFTFDELRNYTMKVVLPKDFILTGGTYYDFVSGTLDPANPKKQYTLKGRFLDKPAVDDCFKVLRKLNNEVFILKNTACMNITDIDVVSNVPAGTVNTGRETLTGIDVSKVKMNAFIDIPGEVLKDFGENDGTFDVNCYTANLFLISYYISDGFREVFDKGGSFVWESFKNDIFIGGSVGEELSHIQLSVQNDFSKYTVTIKIYSSLNGTGTLLGTRTINVYINRNPCPTTTINSLSITATETSLCPGNSSTLAAAGTCPPANISWQKNGTSYGSVGVNTLSTIEAGSYKAVCSSPSITSNTIHIAVSTTPTVPNLTADKHAITPGEFVNLSATNCQGTVVWYGPNNFTDVGDQISTNKPGNYNALCRSNCNGTTYYSDLSGNVSISLLPLRLQADKYEIYSNETAQISAYGCTNGFISWKVNGTAIPNSDNPLTAYGAGTYQAQCTSFNGPSSDWVAIYISPKTTNTPRVTASKSQAFPSDDVVLTASGCPSGWFYAWQIPVHDPVTNAVNVQRWVGNPQNVKGPETYKVQCVLDGNPDGSFESITVAPLSIYDIVLSITPNKTEANPGESVVFTATGNCPNGAGIRWIINGMNYWTWVGETFQATGPGTYSARCESGYQQSKTVYSTIKLPKPGAISIITDKTRVSENELVTLRAIGCDKEVNWTLPNGTEVKGSTVLFSFGPGVYKAKCVRFGFTSDPASITIAQRNWNEPTIVQTNTSIAINEMVEYVIQGCPNDWVQWGVPKKDGNGNTYYDYSYSFKTHIIREPGVYKVRCSTGDYTSFQDIVVHPAPANALFIKANRSVAKYDEPVVLTSYGCPNGTVEWKYGTITTTGTQITVVGPGLRMAHCLNDFSNNGDWAIANTRSDGSITPYLTATVNEACPDQPVTINAYGCPNGWWYGMQWVKPGQLDYWLNNRNAVENFGQGYWDVFEFGGGTVTRNGPNVYYARCISPDGSWRGDFRDKSITVDPAFPADLRATNNGPALTGATSVSLAVTEVPNVGYVWSGPNTFTNTNRSPLLNTPTEANSGVYTVTLKRGTTESWACSTTATTKLTVSGCDIRIKASDITTGLETYVLPYSATPIRDFGDLGLEVVSPSGMPLNNMTFLWTKPDGTTSSEQQLVVDKKGIYSVRVNVTGTTVGCRATVSITESGTRYMLWTKARDLTMLGGTVPVKAIPLKYEEKTDRTIFYGEGGLPTSTDNISGEQYRTKSHLMLYTFEGTPHAEVLRVIPDFNYAKTHTVWNKADFSGRMMVYDYKEKTFLGGWKYTNGVAIKRLYEYETAGATPVGDDCIEKTWQIDDYSIPQSGGGSQTQTSGSKCFAGNGCGWKPTGNVGFTLGSVQGATEYSRPCPEGEKPNNNPTPDYGTTIWIFNNRPQYTNQPIIDVFPEDLRNGGSATPISGAFKQKMSGYIAGFFIEANNVAPKVIIKNQDAVSRQRFKLYVYLLIDELKKAFLQSDDPNVRAYANSIRYPDDATIDAAFYAFGPESGTSWDAFANPYQAANMIVTAFLDSLPIDVYREEKIDAVTKDLSEKVKNAYNALVPILNSCTEGVATGQTVYCTSQAALVMEIRDILISQGKDVSKTLFSFDGGLFAEEADIASIFAGFGSNTTYQGYTITYTPPTANTSASISFKKGENVVNIETFSISSPNSVSRGIDITKIKSGNAIFGLNSFLETTDGKSFVDRFMKIGEKITIKMGQIIKEYAPTIDGDFINSKLLLEEYDFEGTTLGRTYDLVKTVPIGYIPDDRIDLKITKWGTYDIRTGTVINILLKKGLGKEQLTTTLLHEAFVHSTEEMLNLKSITADLNSGLLQIPSDPYSRRISLTNADTDHNRLKAGSVLEYKRACQELDRLYKTNIYTKLYEEDKLYP